MSHADSRYPHMIPVDGRPLTPIPPSLQGGVVAWAMRVSVRTGTQPWFHRVNGYIHFCLGKLTVAPIAEMVWDKKHNRVTLPCEDAVVRKIDRRKIPGRVKDRLMVSHESSIANLRREHVEQDLDDMRPDNLALANYQVNKSKYGRHSKRSVLAS